MKPSPLHWLFIWLISVLEAQCAWVWIEGENSGKSDIKKHPWYYGQTKKEQLSGGDFLAHFDQASQGKAEYQFQVSAAGEYTLWIRANPVQATAKFSLNEGAVTPVDFDGRKIGVTNIAADGAPDLRFIAWCEIGKVFLKAGTNSIRFVFDSKNSNHGSLDCFLLINEAFLPDGTTKPDQVGEKKQQLAAANPGWAVWEPAEDEFKASPIDLRFLNEAYASERGRILAKGEKFIHEKTGNPIRFWAVNGPPHGLNAPELARCARMLAKHGVNMVRIHRGIFDEKTGVLKAEEVRERLAIVEAMKAEGIYTHLSIYFPLWLQPEPGPGWREGYPGGKFPFALLYFEPEFQELYRQWWRAVLTTKGPNGRALIDEPALMGLELVNEDSFFFWTFKYDNIPDPQMRKLEKLFGDWTKKKYGSFEKALSAWSGLKHARDDAAGGRLGFRGLHEMFTQKTPRDQDTAAFLFDTQTKFYADTIKYLRELGFKGMITPSNWFAASSDVFGPLEKLSYCMGDFIDRHGYFSCNHKGENAGWSIRNGHTYSNSSALRFESENGKGRRLSHPVMDPMYNFKPSMISETTWNRPNRYRSEAPLFYSLFGALQDSDAIVHFALDSTTWSAKPGFFMQPWTLMSPSQMGQFPAASMIYRFGLAKTGDLVANLPMTLSDAFALKGSKLVQRANLDELRKSDVMKGVEEVSEAGVDPLIHFVGRTNVTIAREADKAEISDLTKFIDTAAQTVTSSTEEIKLDYGMGLLTLNAPVAQCASGNLKEGGLIDLKDVQIQSNLDLGHIVLVALDAKPLASSSKILLQVMTEEKPANFVTEPLADGVFRIKEIGNSPWLFKEVQGTVRLKRADAGALRVTPLDFNGYPAGATVPATEIALQPDKAYYIIQPAP